MKAIEDRKALLRIFDTELCGDGECDDGCEYSRKDCLIGRNSVITGILAWHKAEVVRELEGLVKIWKKNNYQNMDTFVRDRIDKLREEAK